METKEIRNIILQNYKKNTFYYFDTATCSFQLWVGHACFEVSQRRIDSISWNNLSREEAEVVLEYIATVEVPKIKKEQAENIARLRKMLVPAPEKIETEIQPPSLPVLQELVPESTSVRLKCQTWLSEFLSTMLPSLFGG